jgi:methylase of polypeptide subunit release factors
VEHYFSFAFDDDADFDLLRDLLAAADYDTGRICERMQIPTIYNFRSILEGRTERVDVQSKLDALIRLFMDAEPVPSEVLARFLAQEEQATLRRLGLIREDAEGSLRSTVLLYPTESLLIASDLDHSTAAGKLEELPEDVVYPAITKNTQHFLSSLPAGPCERFLDLCSGTGIAALVASPRATHAWAADVTRRSTDCARFNARLNGIENVTALQGDLYEPVAGMTFDRIVAHPPYIPADEVRFIYRDAGIDGEQLTRRIVEGLPEYLEPGGRLYCTCMVSDRDGRPFEDRVREMLGNEQGGFDVAVVEMGASHATEHYARQAMMGRIGFDEVAKRHDAFMALEITQLVYCSFVVQRVVEPRAVFTLRTQRGPRSTGKDFEWLMSWGLATTDPGAMAGLLEARPRPSARTRLRVIHDMDAPTWRPVEFTLGTESPFISRAECPEWGAVLLTQCDGERTFRDHFEDLKAAGVFPEEADEEEFLELARSLIGAGFVEVAEFPLPFSGADDQSRLPAGDLFGERENDLPPTSG